MQTTSKHRLELFSDAVMAIIITIMVLDLRTPPVGGWRGFVPVLPSVAIYAAGFLQIALLWTLHHCFFEKAVYISRAMLLANFAFLFLLSLLPLMIRSIGEHPKSPSDAVAFLVIGWLCLQSLTLFRLASRSQHADDAMLLAWHRRRNRMTLLGVSIMAVLIGITYASVFAGLLLYAAVLMWMLNDAAQSTYVTRRRV